MSWAKTKKINSDMSTSLDVLETINHIDLVGSNYTGVGDFKKVEAMAASPAVFSSAITGPVIASAYIQHLQMMSDGVGASLRKVLRLSSSLLDNARTMTQAVDIITKNPQLAFEVGASDKSLLLISSYKDVSVFKALLKAIGFSQGLQSNYNVMQWMIDNNESASRPWKLIRENGLADFNKNRMLLDTPGEGIFTVPENVYFLTIECVSGGGAGGGFGSEHGYAGGDPSGEVVIPEAQVSGGGCGTYRIHCMAVTPGEEIPYIVAAKSGRGGAGISTGEPTTFGNIIGKLPIKTRKYSNSQVVKFSDLILPSISGDGGGYGGYGGYGGGDGDISSNVKLPGIGGKDYGVGGSGDAMGTYKGSAGGGGYGGGGGHSYLTSYAGASGGQGIIVLYLGKKELTL